MRKAGSGYPEGSRDVFDMLAPAALDSDDPGLLDRVEDEARNISGWIAAYAERLIYSEGSVSVDVWTLRAAMVSWKLDMVRLQRFHKLSDYPNKVRQAAYFIYWLSKTKPISVRVPIDADNITRYITINERFAVNYATTVFLGLDMTESGDLFKKLVYLLYYRGINPKHLILTLDLLCRANVSKPAEPDHVPRV